MVRAQQEEPKTDKNITYQFFLCLYISIGINLWGLVLIKQKLVRLNNIDNLLLVVFGDKDECILTQDIEIIERYLNNNIKECNI